MPKKEFVRGSQNPALARIEKRSSQSETYHASPGLEKTLAKKAGGYRTAGSGNKHEKGDVRVRGVTRIEHKATKHDSFRVTKEMLDKIELAGRGCDEVPILVVEFVDEQGKPCREPIAVLPLQDILDLLDEGTTKGTNR